MVQGLRCHTPHARGPGLIPGQGTRYRVLQLRPGTGKYILYIYIYIYILKTKENGSGDPADRNWLPYPGVSSNVTL